MQKLVILGSIIGNVEKGLAKWKMSSNKADKHYWLGVIDLSIYLYEEMFQNQPSRVIEIAKQQIGYRG